MKQPSSPELYAEPALDQDWQPDLQRPWVAVYGLEDLSIVRHWDNHAGMENDLREFGANLTTQMLAKAQHIDFPATDPTTLVEEDAKASTFFPMRYVPDLFSHIDSPELFKLADIYRSILPIAIRSELGIAVEPLAPSQRAAETFISDPDKGESLDPHRDERMTVAFYPSPGLGLVVSHCVNARTFADIKSNPSTLVLPGGASFVVFNGVRHPHIGVSLDLHVEDSLSARQAKMQALLRKFKIVDYASNLFEEVVLNGRSERVVNDEYLLTTPGRAAERVVVSMNFNTTGERAADTQQTHLDELLKQAVSNEGKITSSR